jgi:hypothetical protein
MRSLMCYQVLTGDTASKSRGMYHPGRLENSVKLAGGPLHSPSVRRSNQGAVHGSSVAEGRVGGKLGYAFGLRHTTDVHQAVP